MQAGRLLCRQALVSFIYTHLDLARLAMDPAPPGRLLRTALLFGRVDENVIFS